MTDDNSADWRKTTYEGAELEQLQHFRSLSLREKLLMVEEMADRARFLIEQRRERGLPYFDPGTGNLVPGMAVREEHSKYPESKDAL